MSRAPETALGHGILAQARLVMKAMDAAERVMDRIALGLRAEAWRHDVDGAVPERAEEQEHLRATERLRQIIEAEMAALTGPMGASGERTRA